MSSDSPSPTRASARPSVFDGLPPALADLLSLGWEMHHWASRDCESHRPGWQERIADLHKMGIECFRRLETAARRAYGVVRLDSPAFPEWESRVKAVFDSCFELVRNHN